MDFSWNSLFSETTSGSTSVASFFEEAERFLLSFVVLLTLCAYLKLFFRTRSIPGCRSLSSVDFSISWDG
uniref:Uncharacterized protein n=1 Tax=Anguilla anguilla TaxID=7936 RepID=A0A0E9UZJ4_ANGAN